MGYCLFLSFLAFRIYICSMKKVMLLIATDIIINSVQWSAPPDRIQKHIS